jgi:hypothetical protein
MSCQEWIFYYVEIFSREIISVKQGLINIYYTMQIRNMCDFIQVSDHQWSWHAKLQDSNLHRFL